MTFPYPTKDANDGDPHEEGSFRKARFTNTKSYINREKDVGIMYTPGVITPSIDWTTVDKIGRASCRERVFRAV